MVNWRKCANRYIFTHTVAFWPFAFHKKSGFNYMILKAKFINFLISKFKPIILIFLQFFAGIVTAIPKRLIYLSHVFVSNHNSNISNPWNSNGFDNRRKMSIKYLNLQIKKFMDLASRLVWNWPSKLTTQCLDFCEI